MTGVPAPAPGTAIRARAERVGVRPVYLHARYYDRPDLITYGYHHVYTYYDRFDYLHHRVIWPTYCYPVYYGFGPYAHVRYVWPYYHRKYVFVSLGGYWPADYSYVRYYWYGWHPYVWYGYYPVAREVPGDTYNYYTYNYYSDDGGYSGYSSGTPVDQSTWAEVRERLDQQKAAEPAAQTLADTRFDEGVKSFEAGNYGAAAEKFYEAMRSSPNDTILPFAYAQALFADGQYNKAAEMLRNALKTVSPEKEGVFFPRGLYSNDDVLFGQVDNLLDKVDRRGDDADMQLLLGYQLLGIGETGYAREPLEQARESSKNAESAKVLLRLLEKMEKEAGPALKAGGEAANTTDTKADASTEARVGAAPTAHVETTGGAASSGTPDGAAGVAPATPPAETPGTPKTEPSDEGEKKSGVLPGGSTPGAEPPADQKGGGDATGAMQRGDVGSAASESPNLAGLAISRGISGLTGGSSPNFKADVAVFGLMLFLGSIALWIQWRVLGRRLA